MTSVFGHPPGTAPRHGRLWYWTRRRLKRLRPDSAIVKGSAIVVVGLACMPFAGSIVGTVWEQATAPDHLSARRHHDAPAAVASFEAAAPSRALKSELVQASTSAPGQPTTAPAATPPDLDGAGAQPARPARTAARTTAPATDGRSVHAEDQSGQSGERVADRGQPADAVGAARPGGDDQQARREHRKARPQRVVRHGHARSDEAGHYQQYPQYPQWGYAQRGWSPNW